MTGLAELEQGYRRWLRWYPKQFRREHEAEILAVLMAGTRDGQRRPQPAECLDLARGGLGMRLRPRVARSDWPAFTAVRLMYVGAVLELATGVVVAASMGQVRSAIAARNPGYSQAQWHAEVAGRLDQLVVGAGIAAVLCLWLAWANGRGHRWARIVFAMFFGVNTFSLLDGLAHGSALYARADLAAGAVLWLVQLAAVVLAFRGGVRTVCGSETGLG